MNNPDPVSKSRGMPESGSPTYDPEILRIAAAELYAMRRRRDKYIPRELSGEPVWDMLLASYAHRESGIPAGELCQSAAGPQSTGLRWLKAMIGEGLIEHVQPSSGDQTIELFALTKHGRAMIEEALTAMLR